jgi:hypothetical protein
VRNARYRGARTQRRVTIFFSNPRKRYYRTLFLGIAAMATLIWAAIDQFGISPREMLGLFGTTALAVGAIILAGAFIAGIWVGLRAIFRRD